MNSQGMFFFQGMGGIPDQNMFFTTNQTNNGFNMQNSTSQIMIANHNVNCRIRDPNPNMVVSGHNNKVDISTHILNGVIAGHNNKIYSESSSQNQGVLESLVVTGHNNRIENLIIKSLTINGHNNSFVNLEVGNLIDKGLNNKVQNCYQLQNQNSSNNMYQQQQNQQFEQDVEYYSSDEDDCTVYDTIEDDEDSNNSDQYSEIEDQLSIQQHQNRTNQRFPQNNVHQQQQSQNNNRYQQQTFQTQNSQRQHNFNSNNRNNRRNDQHRPHNQNGHNRQQNPGSPNLQFNFSTGNTFMGSQQQHNMQGMPDINGLLSNISQMVNNIPGMMPQNIQMNFQGQMPQTNQFFFQNYTQQFTNTDEHVFAFEQDGEEEDQEEELSPEEIREIINSYPSFKYEEKKGGESSNCAICIDVLKTGHMVKALNCSHKFHSKCINDWLKVKLKCPLCKDSVLL